MITELLDKLPAWGILVFSMFVTFLALEFGFHLGLWRRKGLPEGKKIHTGPVVAATLSLLAFMLAIVFGTVSSRVSELKHIALDEANAIGSVFLRSELLPESERADVQILLQKHINLRLDSTLSGLGETGSDNIENTKKIQDELQLKAIRAGRQNPTPFSLPFFQSIENLIQAYNKRTTIEVRYRLPGVIWIVLFGLAILAMTLGGYDSGVSGERRVLLISILASFAFSVVLTLVVVLDRPQYHIAAVTNSAMIDVRDDINRSVHLQR